MITKKTGMRGSFAAFALVVSTSFGSAQGVPVIDGSNLAQNIEQITQAIADAERQLQQIEEMRAQIEKLTDIENLLDAVRGSLSGLNDIADLYNSATDIRDRAAKITDLSGFANSLSIGDFSGLLDSMLDGDVTMGDRHAQEVVQENLEAAGFTAERLQAMSSSPNSSDAQIAQTAAINATANAAAQISYEEAGKSLERTEGLVEAIGDQETIKESMDLNTRMVAETNYMLGQMWQLNAATGLATGQNGINLAAEQAKERKFFSFNGDAPSVPTP